MHCASCVVLTETELAEHPSVTSARSNLQTRTVEIVGSFGDKPLPEIAKELTGLLSEHTLSTEPERKNVNWKEFTIAAPIAFGFIFLFLLLQKLGIVNLVNAGNVTYGTAFVIGIIASIV
jgi:cation transport ATPase